MDETLIFHPLQRHEIRRIVTLQLDQLSKMLEKNGIELRVTDTALDAIAAAGYDPVYGARPLKRVIQQQIQNPLATELLRGRLVQGDAVQIGFAADQFTFEPIHQEGLVQA